MLLLCQCSSQGLTIQYLSMPKQLHIEDCMNKQVHTFLSGIHQNRQKICKASHITKRHCTHQINWIDLIIFAVSSKRWYYRFLAVFTFAESKKLLISFFLPLKKSAIRYHQSKVPFCAFVLCFVEVICFGPMPHGSFLLLRWKMMFAIV